MTNVLDGFGIIPDGRDVTTGLQAAANACDGDLFLPPGQYGVSRPITLPKSGSVRGISGASKIIALSATGDLLVPAALFLAIDGLDFFAGPGVTRLPGNAAIAYGAAASRNRVTNCRFTAMSNSVWVKPDFGAELHMRELGIYDTVPGGTALQVDAGFDVRFGDSLISNVPGAMPAYGIYVTNVGDFEISRVQVLCCQFGLNVFVPTGKIVASLWIDESFFDNCGRGGSLGAAGGSLVRTEINRSWFSSAHTDHGLMAFTAYGGVFQGLAVSRTTFHANANGHGLYVNDSGVQGVDVDTCRAAGNGLAGFNMQTADWSVRNSRSGACDGFGGNAWGLVASTSPNFTFGGNVMQGNRISPWVLPAGGTVYGNR